MIGSTHRSLAGVCQALLMLCALLWTDIFWMIADEDQCHCVLLHVLSDAEGILASERPVFERSTCPTRPILHVSRWIEHMHTKTGNVAFDS